MLCWQAGCLCLNLDIEANYSKYASFSPNSTKVFTCFSLCNEGRRSYFNNRERLMQKVSKPSNARQKNSWKAGILPFQYINKHFSSPDLHQAMLTPSSKDWWGSDISSEVWSISLPSAAMKCFQSTISPLKQKQMFYNENPRAILCGIYFYSGRKVHIKLTKADRSHQAL